MLVCVLLGGFLGWTYLGKLARYHKVAELDDDATVFMFGGRELSDAQNGGLGDL